MALEFVGGGAVATISGADCTISLPVGIAQNDVVWAACACGSTSDIDITINQSGYDDTLPDLYANDSDDTNLQVFVKRMGVSPDSEVGHRSTTSTANALLTSFHCWRGVDTTNYHISTPTTNTAIDGTQPDACPSINTVVPGAVVLSIVAIGTDDPAASPPSGYTNGNWDRGTDSNPISGGMGSKLVASPAIETPGTWTETPNTGTGGWCAYTIAIWPAGVGVVGRTADGAGSNSTSSDTKIVSAGVLNTSGVADTLTARVFLSSAGSTVCKGVIYADNGSGAPGALLAVTDEGTVNWTTEAPLTMAFSGANRVSLTGGTTYYVGLHWQDPGTPSFAVSSLSSGSRWSNTDTYAGGATDPFGSPTTGAQTIDVYVVVVEADDAPAGEGTQTLAPVTQAASGSAILNATGAGAQTLGAASQAGSGTAVLNAAGVGAQTLPALGQAGAGVETFAGAGVQALQPATQAAAGAETFAAAGVQGLQPVAQAAAGTMHPAGAGSQMLAAASQAATGAETITGSGDQSLAPATQAAAGVMHPSGAGAQTLAPAEQAGSGAETIAGAGAQTLAVATQAGVGSHAEAPAGAGAQTLAAAAQVASGTETIAGTGSQTLAPATQAAAAIAADGASGTAAQTLAAVAQEAAGAVSPVGAGAQQLAAVAQTAAGSETIAGAGEQTLGAATQAAAGVMQPAGAGAQALAAVSQAVAGAETIAAAGAQSLMPVEQAASGVMQPAGVAAQTVAAVEQAGSGAETIAGAAAQALQPAMQAGAGAEVYAGAGSQALQPASQAGAGAETVTGAGAQSLPAVDQAATGSMAGDATGGTGAQTLQPLRSVAAGTMVANREILRLRANLDQRAEVTSVRHRLVGAAGARMGSVTLTGAARLQTAAGAIRRTVILSGER